MSTDLPNWEAKLEGHKFDLEKLSTHFDGEECRVSEKDGTYILTAYELEPSKDHKDANARAEQLVSRINGAMRMFDGGYQPIRLAHVVGYTESGRPTVEVSITDTLRARVTASLDFGGGPTRDQRIPLLVGLSGSDSDLGTILREISDESVDWVRLYKVLELIEKRAGGTVADLGWCSKQRRRDFKYSANSPLTGAEARHAVLPGRAKAPPMSLNEARAFVESLARKLTDQVTANEIVLEPDGGEGEECG